MSSTSVGSAIAPRLIVLFRIDTMAISRWVAAGIAASTVFAACGGTSSLDFPGGTAPFTTLDAAPPAACATGEVPCGGACVALASDSMNCGACRAGCAESQVCAGGHCECP